MATTTARRTMKATTTTAAEMDEVADGLSKSGGSYGNGVDKSIRVIARIRPLLEHEMKAGHTSRALHHDDRAITVAGLPSDGDTEQRQKQQMSRRFLLDAVFGSDASQEDVFTRSGAGEMIAGCLRGYHATIFAYGQTGSGKTHTMDGMKYDGARVNGNTSESGSSRYSVQGPGVTPRCIEHLFELMKKSTTDPEKPGARFAVHVSYVQIYKEKVFDLLNQEAVQPNSQDEAPSSSTSSNVRREKRGLRMRWSRRAGFFLENLYTVSCEDAEAALAALHTGARSKIMASHALNVQSSRSHSIFTLHIKTYDGSSDECLCSSKLSLVDLAGSERGATIAKNSAKLFEESVAINKSLFTLRKVIQVLAKTRAGKPDGETNASVHVPYRDSKLTSLLKESLGGRATSLMIACISVSDRFREENLSTLEYASLAAKITNRIAIDEDARARLIRQLREEVAFLKRQLAAVSSARHELTQSGDNDGAVGTKTHVLGLELPSEHTVPSKKRDEEQDVDTVNANNNRRHDVNAYESPALGAGGSDITPGDTDESVRKTTSRAQPPANEADMQFSVHIAKRSGMTMDGDNDVSELLRVNDVLNTKLEDEERLRQRHANDNTLLMNENASLRDKIDFLEAVLCVPAPEVASMNAHDSDKSKAAEEKARQLHTASEAAVSEVLELRRENKSLHERLKKASAAQSTVDAKHRADRLQQGSRSSGSNGGRSGGQGRGSSTRKKESRGSEPMKISSGRLSSTGFVSAALVRVAEAAVPPADLNSSLTSAVASDTAHEVGDGINDENEARLSKLMQARNAMVRDHIVKQSFTRM